MSIEDVDMAKIFMFLNFWEINRLLNVVNFEKILRRVDMICSTNSSNSFHLRICIGIEDMHVTMILIFCCWSFEKKFLNLVSIEKYHKVSTWVVYLILLTLFKLRHL